MRIAASIALIAELALGATAKQRSDPFDVIVSIQEEFPVENVSLSHSQARATAMFARAGVRVGWTFRSWPPEEKNPGCGAGVPMKLSVHLVRSSPGKGLGYAQPYAKHDRVIVIRYDRLELTYGSELREALLAHVLVHEITHALQAVAAHDETGIMKAAWGPAEVLQMPKNPLPFTAEATLLIHAGLQKAAEDACATRPKPDTWDIPSLSVIFP